MVMRKTLIVLLLCGAWACLGPAAVADDSRPDVGSGRGVAPLFGDVVRPFDPPDQPWLSGHRGVDLAGQDGQAVMAAVDGVVAFAGLVAGRPVLTLRHGEVTTTYEPVEAAVVVGQSVSAGQVVGRLITGHACPAEVCLHWGLRQDDTYLDPLSLLSGGPIRLIAAVDMEQLRDRAAAMVQPGLGGGVSPAGLVSPAAGLVSSLFGLRLHPIDAVWRFHNGLDIAAACG